MRIEMRKFAQSIYDTLIRIMPSLKDKAFVNQNYINPNIANSLFNIWRTSGNKINDNIYKRPTNVSLAEVQQMQKAGLVKSIGSNLEITDKGTNVIKVMILGDNSSSFDENGIIIDYNQALSNIQEVKTAGQKVKVASWWDRFEKESQRGRYQGQTAGDEFRPGQESTEERYLENELVEGKHVKELNKLMKALDWVGIGRYVDFLKAEGFDERRIDSIMSRAGHGVKI